jgi:hypothetical protein
MLESGTSSLSQSGDRKRGAIEFDGTVRAGPVHNGRREISVRRHSIGGYTLWDAWAANNERHIDIFFVGTTLAGWKPVLSDMKAIVTSVNDKCVV